MADDIVDPSSLLEVALDETLSSVSSAPSPSPVEKKGKRSMTDGYSLPEDSPLRIPFAKGWKREVVQRQGGVGKGADTYYFGPSGKKYRSIPDILKAVGPDGKEADPTLGKENFSFAKHVLGYDVPEVDFLREANLSKGRTPSAVSDSPPPKKPKITKAPDPPKKKQTARKTMPTAVKAEQIVCEPVLCEASSTSDAPDSDSQPRVLSSLKLLRVDSSTDGGKDPEQEGSDTSGETSVRQGRCCCRRCASLGPGKTVVCCGNVEFLRSAKTDKYHCITRHHVFKKLVLDKDALTLTRHLLCLKTKNSTKKNLLNAQEPLNISWRYVAYKQFVSWVNTCISVGGKVQVAIPSCVVQAVREAFPENDGKYSAIQFTG